MRTLRYLHVALIALLSFAVLFSATGKVSKAPYKPCLSRLTHQVKLVGVPEARQELAATRAAEPASGHDAWLLLGFSGFGLRDAIVSASPIAAPDNSFLPNTAPQQAPFALRI